MATRAVIQSSTSVIRITVRFNEFFNYSMVKIIFNWSKKKSPNFMLLFFILYKYPLINIAKEPYLP